MLVFASLSAVQAADMAPPSALRGAFSAPEVEATNWDGVYFGGLVGYSTANFRTDQGLTDLYANMFRGLAVEARYRPSENQVISTLQQSGRGMGYGAFIGYNLAYDDVIVGVEADYQRVNLRATATGNVGYQYPLRDAVIDGATGVVLAPGREGVSYQEGTLSSKISDVVTLRGRAGASFGSFLPFITGGVALGRAEYERRALLRYTEYNTPPYSQANTNRPQIAEDKKRDEFRFGYTIGAGVDILLANSVFLRGEYQYINFPKIANARVDLHQARAGLGVKF
jgi:opacity protein-like surface antigen